MVIFFTGTAGSGKTTTTAAFGRYLEKEGYTVGYVNLDTGVKRLPYRADIDVREFVTVEELMNQGYGPNGAIVESYERLKPLTPEIAEKMARLEGERDYVLVDTPGQMESFLFHEFGAGLMGTLHEPLIFYLFSPEILKRPQDFCFVRFFALMMEMRLGATTVPVLNKVDTVKDIEPYRRFLEDFEYLTARLKFEPSMGAYTAYRLCSFLPEVSAPVRVLFISARSGEGLDDILDVAYEYRCTCGDLT